MKTKFICGSIQFLRAIFSIIIFLHDFSALSKISRKRKSNELEIWDWGSEQGVKKRYERAWAYISRGDRDNDEGWKRVAARSESVLNTCFLYRVSPPSCQMKDIWHFKAQRDVNPQYLFRMYSFVLLHSLRVFTKEKQYLTIPLIFLSV